MFVDVEHVTRMDGEDVMRETQTLVYKEAASQAAGLPKPQPHDLSEWAITEILEPSAAMLFRYSALTFNAHRIHYDLPYTRDVEAYPALVVHGPLMASLLLRFATTLLEGKTISRFKFRGFAPAYCDQALTLAAKPNSKGFELGIFGCDGNMIMGAELETN